MKRSTCIGMAAGLAAATLLAPLHADSSFETALQAQPVVLPSSAPLHEVAQSNYEAMIGKGVEAYHIQFDWGYRVAGEYQASLVVFRDDHGRYWGKVGSKMKWLSGKTPSEWVQRLFPDKVTEVVVVQKRLDPDEIAFLQSSLAPQSKIASD